MNQLAGKEFKGKAGETRKAIDADEDKQICQNEFRTYVCTDLGLNCEAAAQAEKAKK